MIQYQELLRNVRDNGDVSENRTGVKTVATFGELMRFQNVADQFPIVTTKRVPFKAVIGELCAFLRASRSAKNFRDLGCKVWDQNANENKAWLANGFRKGEDDLGPIYGVQWREWAGYKLIDTTPAMRSLRDEAGYKVYADNLAKLKSDGWREIGETHPRFGEYPSLILYRPIDQLGDCLKTIVEDPDNRRILFHGWNPAVLDEVALPACHLLYQFKPNKVKKTIDMLVYLRSNDLGLGAPFNIAESGALMHLVGRLTGYKPGTLTVTIGDAHIYENHMEMVDKILAREPLPLPTLKISDRVPDYAVTGKFEPEWLEKIEPDDFVLEGYEHHPAIPAPMAV